MPDPRADPELNNVSRERFVVFCLADEFYGLPIAAVRDVSLDTPIWSDNATTVGERDSGNAADYW